MPSPVHPSELPIEQAARGSSDRFTDLGEVSRGGMGRINASRDRVIGRRVATKVLLEEHREDALLVAKFAQEARITGQLEHPNIVPIYDFGESTDGPYMVMKLIRGETLLTLLSAPVDPAKRHEELRRWIEILTRLCDAVAFAHNRGVIHCDLKPGNVMIGDFGQVYLMDWGCALLTGHREPGVGSAALSPIDAAEPGDRESFVRTDASPQPESYTIRGTPEYMAPEQLAGQGATIDVRTDVFGIGGILYELLMGEAPNDRSRLVGPGLSRHPVELPSTSATWGPIPPVLAGIAAKALAPDPAARYPDVLSLRADLDGFLKGGGWFETRTCEPGQFIVKEGEPGDAAYIIESGHCEVTKIVRGAETVIRQLGPGDVFGETAVLTRAQRTATVRALDAVTLKVITAESLNFELEQNPWLAVFVRSLAGLFREADARLARDDSAR